MQFPKLRSEIKVTEFYDSGEKFVELSDELAISPQNLALPYYFYDILIKNQAEISFEESRSIILSEKSNNSDILVNLLTILSNLHYFESPVINIYRDIILSYLANDFREPVCAGTSYPNESKELKKYLDDLLSRADIKTDKPFKKIIAPHIDYQIGKNAHRIYANTFSNLDTDFDLAILFGTAHYKSSSDFMLTKKHFNSPLGQIKTDLEFIKLLQNELNDEIVFDDLAHRNEHSLELHLIILQHIMKSKDFKILPILNGSFHSYFYNSLEPSNTKEFENFLRALNKAIKISEKKVIYLSSGDLSHIGQKFGDEKDAKNMLASIEKDDLNLIDNLICKSSNKFYKNIAKNHNKNRVCGLSPFYSLIETGQLNNATFCGYHKWYEYETKSAVSFCGIGYT